MNRNQQGGSVAVIILLVLAVLVVGGIGYMVYKNNHKTVVTVTKTTATFSGPTAGVDTANDQELNGETAADNQTTTSDQSTASTINQAAGNVGGAYDESSY